MNFRKNIIGTVIITLLAVVLIAYVLKPKYDESFYKKHREDLLKKEAISKLKIDSIQNIRYADSLRLIDSLNAKNEQIFLLKNQYNNALSIIRKHEKALNTYRNGNVNDRFSTFTELISSTDTIQRP